MKSLKIITSVVVAATVIQLNSKAPASAAVINEIDSSITTESAVTIKLKTVDGDSDDKNIELKDSTLESIVREEIGKKTGNITKKDMLNVKRLIISNKVIHSLSGLEYATNLGGITATNCTIDGDMSPICKLSKFTYISFHNCNVGSLEGLPSTLTTFSLYECNIKDNKLSLEGQANLKTLDVTGCDIDDISCLKDSLKLQYVRLCQNNIKDITVLGNLTQIENLQLFKNKISDISPIEHLINLKHLWLENNDITDITPLKSLKKLEYLNIANDNRDMPDNKIVDITALSGNVSNMESIYLYLNRIKTYEALNGIPDDAKIHGTAWLTVRYVDENDQDISESFNRSINFADSINFKITKDYSDSCVATAGKIDGYILNDDNLKSVEFDKNDLIKTIIFHYKKDKAITTSKVQDSDKPKKTNEKKEDPIDKPIDEKKEEKIIKGMYTLRYITDEGKLLEAEKINTNLELGTYVEKSKEFEGYKLNDKNIKSVTLTEDNREGVIEFRYKKVQTKVPTIIPPEITVLPQTGEKVSNNNIIISILLLAAALLSYMQIKLKKRKEW